MLYKVLILFAVDKYEKEEDVEENIKAGFFDYDFIKIS